MMQSTSSTATFGGLHAALIMDGSGRWAQARGLARTAGHRAGAQAVRRVVAAAPGCGIGTLTLFAFTGQNWERPAGEVAVLMEVFRDFLLGEREEFRRAGVRLKVMGRRDRLPRALVEAIQAAECATAACQALHLRLAIDYSARDSLLCAARRLGGRREATREEFARLLAEAEHAGAPAPEIDLLIRTGGEQRLSDCLLWEGAYAELVFSERLWPDFDARGLEAAVGEFHSRDRRFGRIPERVAV
jgi:undecaprenyl diphosphate synthase